MRLKEFIIFIVLFTIAYWLFFFVLDIIHRRNDKKRQEQRFQMIMNGERFLRFAQFYGLNITYSNEQLNSFYQILLKAHEISLSVVSTQLQISVYELIVIILYFEFFPLIDNKSISIQEGIARPFQSGEHALAFKYGAFFLDKYDYEKIHSIIGDNALNDINYIQTYYLSPGVRFVDSKLYYVEGVDIHA